MRRALAAAAVLAAVGCKQQAPQAPATTVVEWAQGSPDGRFELRQRREGSGCRVQAVVKSADGERTLWSTQNCLPTPSGLAFLSPNGEKVLVLDLFPSGQAAHTSDWSQLPLLALWVRGAVVRQYTGAEILGPDRSADMSKVLSWVRGDTYEDMHRAARPSAEGEHISVELADGRTLTLGFEGGPLPAPAAAPARQAARARDDAAAVEPSPPGAPARTDALPAADRTGAVADRLASDERGLYRWEDDQGGLHFGAGAQIPARYRKRARPVDATVGVVPLEPISATAQPAAAGAERQPAAGTPAPQPAGAAPAPAGSPAADRPAASPPPSPAAPDRPAAPAS